MNVEKMKYRKVSELHPLPENPRKINRADLDRLVNSLRINGFWEHQPMAVEEQGGKLIVLSGNQRLKTMKNNKKRIELSDLELEMTKRHLNGDFFPPEQTDEENRAFARVIDKADKLMGELDAYDELDRYENMSLIQWYYDKYRQQTMENEQ